MAPDALRRQGPTYAPGADPAREPVPAVAPDPPSSRCRNCEAPLAGRWCAACGQEDRPLDPTFRDLLAEAWDAFVSIDGKLFASVRLLLTRPGELSARHFAGRRAAYLPPLRLYLTCSLAFFLLQAVLPDGGRMQIRVTEVQNGFAEGWEDAPAGRPSNAFERRIQRGMTRARADGKAFADGMLQRAPQVIFAMVPVQALLLAAVYRRRRRALPAHFVVALHTHATFFVALAVWALVRRVPHTPTFLAATSALAALLVATLPIAMRRVYGGRWWPTLLRGAFVVGGYVAVLGPALATYLMSIYWTLGGPGT